MTKQWDYGDAGDRFPVQVGEIWSVGPHLFVCGDLENGVGQRLFELCAMLGKSPTMFYSDPPWDAGNAKAFRTKFEGPSEKKIDFPKLMGHVLAVASKVPDGVFIEMGAKHLPDMPAWFEAYSIPYLCGPEITYYKKHKAYLCVGGQALGGVSIVNKHDVGVEQLFEGKDDHQTPQIAMREFTNEGDVVLETCLGLGATSRAAQETGRICVASELNPRRMARSIADLVDKHKLKAERVK